jgi:glycosyltransferase involved in cell wall biosynthesis
VVNVLEVLTDLTPHVEVLIVDDGSTDQTEEVIREISREYPQIHAIRHARRRGLVSAARTGVKQAWGEIIMVHDILSPLSDEVVRQLWKTRHENKPGIGLESRGPLSPRVRREHEILGGTQLWQRHDAGDHCSWGVSPESGTTRVTRADLADEVPPPLATPSSLVHS